MCTYSTLQDTDCFKRCVSGIRTDLGGDAELLPFRARAHSNGDSEAQQRSQLLGGGKDRVAHARAQAALQEENDDFIGGEQQRVRAC